MKTTNRDSNIELLRIIGALSVIILHLNGYIGGILQKMTLMSFDSYIVVILEGFAAVAVNVFLLIFGYYQSTKDCIHAKGILVFIDVVFYNILFYLLDLCIGKSEFSLVYLLSRLLPINYYIILYIGVYVLSPYINLLIKHLNTRETVRLCGILVLLISIEPFTVDCIELITHQRADGLSFIGINGDQHGYTLLNFLLIYFIGATLRKCKEKIVNRSCLFCWGVYCLGSLIISVFEYLSLVRNEEVNIVLNYNNPLIILNSIFLFLSFSQLEIKNSKIVNFVAKGSLTVYLTHAFILEILLRHINMSRLNMYSVIIIPIALIVYGIGLFLYVCFNRVINQAKNISIKLLDALNQKYVIHNHTKS